MYASVTENAHATSVHRSEIAEASAGPVECGVQATEAVFRSWAQVAVSAILEVPPDGHCVLSCTLAARDVVLLRALSQNASSLFCSPREDRDLLIACRRLRETGVISAEDGRFDSVESLSGPDLPEEASAVVCCHMAGRIGGRGLGGGFVRVCNYVWAFLCPNSTPPNT